MKPNGCRDVQHTGLQSTTRRNYSSKTLVSKVHKQGAQHIFSSIPTSVASNNNKAICTDCCNLVYPEVGMLACFAPTGFCARHCQCWTDFTIALYPKHKFHFMWDFEMVLWCQKLPYMDVSECTWHSVC